MEHETHTISDKTRQMQLENDLVIANAKSAAVSGLLVLGGMLIVGATVVAIIAFASDSVLIDALQECKTIQAQEPQSVGTRTYPNPDIAECRAQVFKHFGEVK